MKDENSDIIELLPGVEVIYYESYLNEELRKKARYAEKYVERISAKKIRVAEPIREDAFRNIFGGKRK